MTQASPHGILLVTGLQREARIIGDDNAQIIVGGGQSERLAHDLERAATEGARAFLSMGIAGGLRPGLPSGTVIIASAVIDKGRHISTAPAWAERLNRAIPDSISGDIAGVDHMAAEVAGKAVLHQMTETVAVDMESHIVARVADRYGIPFAALRVIADPAERALPLAAQAGFSSDGTVNVGAVIRSLLASPGQAIALIRTAGDARAAFHALSRCRRLIGSGFCFPDFG